MYYRQCGYDVGLACAEGWGIDKGVNSGFLDDDDDDDDDNI